jgi:multisubunit Na+/H+ antiporter MnhE subunit
LISDAIFCIWTFNRAYSHASIGSTILGLGYSLINIDKGHAVIPLAFYLGYLSWHHREIDNKLLHAGIVMSLILTLTIGCSLSGRNYPHYAIIALPLICVVTSFCFDHLQRRYGASNWLLIGIVAVFSWRLALAQSENMYQAYKPDKQLENIVLFIQHQTDKNSKIAVIGNDSQLYYLSDRKSSSRFHYTFPILDIHTGDVNISAEYVNDLRLNKPELIVVKTTEYPQLPNFIFNFITENYRPLSYKAPSAQFYIRTR